MSNEDLVENIVAQFMPCVCHIDHTKCQATECLEHDSVTYCIPLECEDYDDAIRIIQENGFSYEMAKKQADILLDLGVVDKTKQLDLLP